MIKDNIFREPEKVRLNFGKMRNTIKLFDRVLSSKANPMAARMFCSGYALALATYTDIDQVGIRELKAYIKVRSGA